MERSIAGGSANVVILSMRPNQHACPTRPWSQNEETTLTIREDLQCLAAELGDEQAAEALDYIRWLASAGDALTDYELAAMYHGEKEIADGAYVRLEELSQTLGG